MKKFISNLINSTHTHSEINKNSKPLSTVHERLVGHASKIKSLVKENFEKKISNKVDELVASKQEKVNYIDNLFTQWYTVKDKIDTAKPAKTEAEEFLLNGLKKDMRSLASKLASELKSDDCLFRHKIAYQKIDGLNNDLKYMDKTTAKNHEAQAEVLMTLRR